MSKLTTHRLSIGDASMKTTIPMAAIFATPDEARLVVVMKATTFEVWDRATGKPLSTFELGQPGGAPGGVTAAALSPDGASLFVGWNSGHLDRYDVATGKQAFSIWAVKKTRQPMLPPMQHIALDRAGRRVATHGETEPIARVWDAATGALVREFPDDPEHAPAPLALTPDGSSVWIRDGLYDVGTGSPRTRHPGDAGWDAALFFPDGVRLALANTKGTVTLFDCVRNAPLWTTKVEGGYFRSLTLSPDGSTLFALGLSVAMLETTTGRVQKDERNLGWKAPIALPGAGEVLGLDWDSQKSVARFDLRRWKKIESTTPSHSGPVVAIAVSPLGRTLLSGSTDKTARIWHLEAGDELQTFACGDPVIAVAYSPDGMRAAIADKSELKIYQIGSYPPIFEDQAFESKMTSLDFSPDGQRLVVCNERGDFHVWDVAQRKVVYSKPRAMAKLARYTDDGRSLVVSSTRCALEVRDANTGEVERETETFDREKTHEGILFPDERVLAVITKKGLTLRMFGVGGVQHAFGTPDLAERLLAVSRDRTTAVTVGIKGEVAVWRVTPRPGLIDVIELPGDRAECASLRQDGRVLVVGTSRGIIHVYDLADVATAPVVAPPAKPKPPRPPARDPIEALRAFAAGTASKMEALRALVEHDGWVVPAVAIAKGDEVFEHALMLGAETRLPPGEFWAFTDKPHALQAAQQGAMLGLVVDPVPGTRVFSSLGQSAVFHVNRGAPPAETWNVPAESYDLCTLFAKVVAMERMLDSIGEPDEEAALRALADYEGYLLFLYDDGEHQAPAECHERFGLKRAAHVFTTPDQRDAFAKKRPEMLEGNYKAITLPGSKLFAWLKEQSFIDGFVLNSEGSAPRGIPLDVCDRILALPRAPELLPILRPAAWPNASRTVCRPLVPSPAPIAHNPWLTLAYDTEEAIETITHQGLADMRRAAQDVEADALKNLEKRKFDFEVKHRRPDGKPMVLMCVDELAAETIASPVLMREVQKAFGATAIAVAIPKRGVIVIQDAWPSDVGELARLRELAGNMFDPEKGGVTPLVILVQDGRPIGVVR